MLQEIVGAVPVSQLKRGGNSHARPHDFTRKERKVFKMCKPTTTITAKVEELMELRKLAEELQVQMEAITDEIKQFMGDEETMMAGSYTRTIWKNT